MSMDKLLDKMAEALDMPTLYDSVTSRAVPRRAMSVANLTPGMRISVKAKSGNGSAEQVIASTNPLKFAVAGKAYSAAPDLFDVFDITIIADPLAAMGPPNERGDVPTSGRLLGASPIPRRPEPPRLVSAATFTTGVITTHCAGCGERARICCGSLATWRCKSCCKSHGAHAVEHVGSTCHPKCTMGAPCRRAKCGNLTDDSGTALLMRKRDGERADMRASWKRWMAAPADPLAAMLGSPGVCVMRGRRRL